MTLQELFTSIANAIRSKKNTTDKIIATDFPNAIESIESGDISEYFCDTLTGNTSSSSTLIYRYIKKIPDGIKVVGTVAKNLFTDCTGLKEVGKIDTSEIIDFTNMFRECNELIKIAQIDTSKGEIFESMLLGCSALLDIPKIDTSNGIIFGWFFRECVKLRTILELDMGNAVSISDMLYNCKELVNLGGFKNLGKAFTQETNNYSKYSLNLTSCDKLTHESLMNVINSLYDLNLSYNVANGGTLYTQKLTLGTTNKAKLTSEEIAIATQKGWTIA